MFERSVSADVVARAFLLAEALKKAPPDRDAFRAMIEEERKKLAALTITQVLGLIEPDRRKRIESGTWVFSVINLDRCAVWPRMGGEDWARGPVAKIAGQFPSKAMPGNKTRPIRERAQEIFGEFPLIAIRTRSDYGRYRLEDGSHRAIAYYLAGFRQAFAYVARVPSGLNLTWKWEG
jgi:hypothetical protein